MKQLITKSLATSLLILLTAPSFAQKEKNRILGVWYNSDKSAMIEFFKCAENGDRFCGKILWLKEPKNDHGKPKTDSKNPNKNLQNRRLKELTIFEDFEYDGNNEWQGGIFYDPEKGQTYDGVSLDLIEPDKLELHAYIGFSLMGRTLNWTRAK